MRVTSRSPRMTRALGALLARELAARSSRFRHATVVALKGPLGAGKTTFVGGFARALGIRRNLPSPTFIFVRRYPLKRNGYRNLFHVDAYRVRSASKKMLAPLGLMEEFERPTNLFLIEWAEHLKRALPTKAVRVTFRHSKRAHERIIVFGK